MRDWNQYSEKRLSELTARLKRRRVEMFLRVCGLGPSDTVLDLGSEDGSYLGSLYPYPENVVLADIDRAPMVEGVRRYGLKDCAVIPPDGPLPFRNGMFDAVWCNSVIEHVTVPRAALPQISEPEFRRSADAHQQLFAREIARVGRQYFVQTPYVHFPIEAHSWLPCVQYLPQPLRWRASRALKQIWIKQWRADFLLYDIRRFRSHFPDASAISLERFCGLPKSLIAVRSGTGVRRPRPLT